MDETNKLLSDASALIDALNKIPPGTVHETDRILRRVLEEPRDNIAGTARMAAAAWYGSADKRSVERIFELLTGICFRTWLRQCVKTAVPDRDGARIAKAERILADNGIEPDECQVVLQAIGYALLDEELYPEPPKTRKEA